MRYYVQRDTSGKVTGLYTVPQPQADGSVLTEPTPLPDTHPDVVAFLNPPPPPPSALAQALDAALVGPTPTPAQIQAVFRAWRATGV